MSLVPASPNENAEEAKLNDRSGCDNDEEQPADRGRLPEVPRAHVDDEQIEERRCVGGRERTAFCQDHIWLCEELKGPDGVDHERK